jgi:hypothetical protein
MSFLFGTAPKATFSTQPTIDPTQAGLLSMLASFLGSGATPPGVQAYPGQQFGAPLSPLQSSALTALQPLANTTTATPTPGQTSAVNAALGALPGDVNYTAPQITAPSNVTPQQVTAPTIDATQAFAKGVVEPLTSDFLTQTLPAIAGQQGGSAGGAYGTQGLQARETAGTNLDRTLAQAGSQYSLAANEANQQAVLQSLLANQAAGLTAAQGNQATQLATVQGNQAAQLSGQELGLQALGLAPSVAGLPGTTQSANINPILQLLGAGAVPQQTQQTQLTGQYQDFLNQLNQRMQLLQLLAGTGTTQTQQTLGVGTGGQTGLLQGLLGGLAGNQGVGNALGGLITSTFG